MIARNRQKFGNTVKTKISFYRAHTRARAHTLGTDNDTVMAYTCDIVFV